MKTRIIIVAIISLTLGGCAGIGKSVFDGGISVTASVDNPVTLQQLAAVEGAYGVAATAVDGYFRLRQCRKSEVESFTNLCSRYSVKMKLQAANRKAFAAVMALSHFVKTNQQISALSALGSAQKALIDFRNAAAVNGIPAGGT